MGLTGEKKKAYQRELMRKRRAEKKAAGLDVAAEVRRQVGDAEAERLDKELRDWGKGAPMSEGDKKKLEGEMKARHGIFGGKVPPIEVYLKPKEATEEEWAYALVRASRAREYAKKMPEHVYPKDLVYQDPVWQWEHQVKGRAVPC